jgi:hypothetical protein
VCGFSVTVTPSFQRQALEKQKKSLPISQSAKVRFNLEKGLFLTQSYPENLKTKNNCG